MKMTRLRKRLRGNAIGMLAAGLTVLLITCCSTKSEAQDATAVASGTFSVTGSNWILGPTSLQDNGGNYSSSADHGTISVTIAEGGSHADGDSATINQIFWATPYTGICPPLFYHITVSAVASTNYMDENALGVAYWSAPMANPTAATAGVKNGPDTQTDSNWNDNQS